MSSDDHAGESVRGPAAIRDFEAELEALVVTKWAPLNPKVRVRLLLLTAVVLDEVSATDGEWTPERFQETVRELLGKYVEASQDVERRTV